MIDVGYFLIVPGTKFSSDNVEILLHDLVTAGIEILLCPFTVSLISLCTL